MHKVLLIYSVMGITIGPKKASIVSFKIMRDDNHIKYYICKARDRAEAYDWRDRGTSFPKGPCVEVGRQAKPGCTESRPIGRVIDAA